MKKILAALLVALPALAETKARNAVIQGAPVNAVDKGADPTGVNDSQPGIQTCATAAAAVTGMCVVPAGTYKLNSNVVTTTAAIMVYQGAVFTGTGRILLAAGTPSAILTIPSDIQINHLIWPVAPSLADPTKYPLGSDFWSAVRGSADLRLQDWSYNMTSTTSVGAPGSVTITVGTGKVCPSTATADPNCSASVLPFSGTTSPTSNLCTPAGACSLWIDQDTPNEELITSVNWSVVSATTITATFAKAHTQPFNVRQIGGLLFDVRSMGFNVLDVADRPITLGTRTGNIGIVTNDTSGTWPLSAWRWNAFQTGMNGANLDLLYRNNTSASSVIWKNAANTAVIAILQEASNGAVYKLGNVTNFPLRFDATGTDLGRIFGGGTNPGLMFYSTQTGAGTSGVYFFRDNSTDNNDAMKIDVPNKSITLIAKTFATLGTPANGNFAYCSDCTIANPCAGAGTGALAKRLNGVWVCN